MLDAIFMIIKLIVLSLWARCSAMSAAQHVWYDRFDQALDQEAAKNYGYLYEWLTGILAWIIIGPGKSTKVNNTQASSEQAGVQTMPSHGDGIGLEDLHPDNPLPSVPTSRAAGPSDQYRPTITPIPHDRPVVLGALPAPEQPSTSVTDLESHQEDYISADSHMSSQLEERPSIDLADENRASMESEETRADHQPPTTNQESEQEPLIGESPKQFYDGSGIDRSWRLSFLAFLIGAVPQAVKVFSMRGVGYTQTLISMYLIGFGVPEVFRMMAGTAGDVQLRPLPMTNNIKDFLAPVDIFLGLAASIITFLFADTQFFYFAYAPARHPDHFRGGIGVRIGQSIRYMMGPLVLAVWSTLFVSILWRASKKSRRTIQRLAAIAMRGHWSCTFRTTSAISKCVLSLFGAEQGLHHFGPWIALYLVMVFACALIQALVPLDEYALIWRLYINGKPRTIDATLETFLLFFWTLGMSLEILVFPLAASLIVAQLLFRLAFIGCLSHYPRKLTGMKGMWTEFVSSYLIMTTFFQFLYIYSCSFYMPGWDKTYKPPWTDYLG